MTPSGLAMRCSTLFVLLAMVLLSHGHVNAQTTRRDDLPIVEVPGQPLGANVSRLIDAFAYLGVPLGEPLVTQLNGAIAARDAQAIQRLLDPNVLLVVSINPEVRIKVRQGPAQAELQQGGYTPVIVKVVNESTVASPLKIVSPQAGPVYAGAALGILARQAQTELNENENVKGVTDRFLDVEMFQAPPMTRNLSGLPAEYAIALIYSSESGMREATVGFDLGAGNQDLGFRGETPLLFRIRPAVDLPLEIFDVDGTPTAGRITVRDHLGHVYPPQAKRLAPDFFFQPQVYRQHGQTIRLPVGEFEVTYSRGPEYQELVRSFRVTTESSRPLRLELKRWVAPQQYGFYCGDHHIHAAGCSHYQSPTQGVTPRDMFYQVKGEGLHVGCVLTWGPCFDFQRNFFSPQADEISERGTLLKYDLEISGFGSHAMGHVCLLNLRDQTYPGSEGTKLKGWPTWTVPVLAWAKEQGGVTGFPHSALSYDPPAAGTRLLRLLDRDGNDRLSTAEADHALLPESFSQLDADGNLQLDLSELVAGTDRSVDRLPNVALPNMNGGGALEICVSTAAGVCDFVSAMDTKRNSEWNTWYHLMNCGFPLKVSGETDFPCMSSRRVGQGRVYVQLGTDIDALNFSDWCAGLAAGRSYVSDGYAHALQFAVNDVTPGTGDVELKQPGTVTVTTRVAFASEVPEGVAYGNQEPVSGRRTVGDTVQLHAPRSTRRIRGGMRLVEVVVNGEVVAERHVPADASSHALQFEIPITKSSWVALRHFPQLHTNPVNVLVAGRPIRASTASALWCAEVVRMLWELRNHQIAAAERPAAKQAYDEAIAQYERIAQEASQVEQ